MNELASLHVESCIMNWIQGTDRNQVHMLPPCIEDYVGPNNPVRLLDAFVEGLELKDLGFAMPKENSQERGRPAYHRGDLLKLYLYGYVHRVRSSRRLERECHCNLEVIWLLKGLKPDFKTIADFRKDNAPSFKAVVRQLNKLCQELDLFGGELMAIDGTKMKGQNAPGKNWTLNKLQKQQDRLEERLAEYLQALERADEQEQGLSPAPSVEQLKQKIEQLKARKEQVRQKRQSMEESGQSQISATDPESRNMKGAHGHLVGYNVQGAVDAKHHLLASTEVTNRGVDQGQLAQVAQAAKEALQIERADVVADGGYFVAEDIKRCQEMGMEPYLAPVNNSPSERAGLFGKSDFHYERDTDSYTCPAGQQLSRRREAMDKGRLVYDYDNPKACAQCPIKSRCTQARFRTVSRWEHEEVLERMAAKVAAEPQKLAQRKTLIEHCWGTIKWLMPEGFLLKGLRKVRAEMSLAHFAYNFKRALEVVGFARLLQALTRRQGSRGPHGSKAGPNPLRAPIQSLIGRYLGLLRPKWTAA